jgi:hypothetical protein
MASHGILPERRNGYGKLQRYIVSLNNRKCRKSFTSKTPHSLMRCGKKEVVLKVRPEGDWFRAEKEFESAA